MRAGLAVALVLALAPWRTSTFEMEWSEDALSLFHQRHRLSQPELEVDPRVQARMDKYMIEGMNDVIGWFDLQALLVLRVLSAHQIKKGVEGGVAEIGVHHGKTFTALSLMNLDAGRQGGRAVAIDVFEEQDLNVDGSGEGDRQELLRTLERWCGDVCVTPDKLAILQTDSMILQPEQVLQANDKKKLRIFSIDGSHTAEATYNDLSIAARVLAQDGIIMVDDFFAEGWPGVSEGVMRFYYNQSSLDEAPLVPFFVGFNKVLFAREEVASEYIDKLVSEKDVIGDDTMKLKTQTMLGKPIIVMSEEVQCRKKKRSLLPGETCPAGYQCS